MTIISSGETVDVSAGQTDVGDVVLSGGALNVLSGGTASATTISSDGFEFVASGGAALGTIISGGTLELAVGASAGSAAITFAGSDGTLQIDDGTSMPSNVIGGLVPSDIIDLAGVSFDSAGSVTLLPG